MKEKYAVKTLIDNIDHQLLDTTYKTDETETKAIEKVGADFQTMEWTVERENGRAVYEFDMTTGGGKKAEVKVDGMNGKVLSAKVKNTKY